MGSESTLQFLSLFLPLFLSVGARERILDLLLSLNPLWLRISVETVFGELLLLSSNDDVAGISRFVVSRLLNDPTIAKKFSHPTVPHLYLDG